ncbi:hypothetical protein FLAPXU55_00502 [Flavobacterium panici]|uniref:Uncharacterized protein n=1 Tax=Flavobacterium panici TaxID=2654843 RepID=A0A9N8IZW7_9FLAO|nr:hypothetical protein FLAPXU55_00502 [Flavobacterium panici]
MLEQVRKNDLMHPQKHLIDNLKNSITVKLDCLYLRKL